MTTYAKRRGDRPSLIPSLPATPFFAVSDVRSATPFVSSLGFSAKSFVSTFDSEASCVSSDMM